MNGRTVSLLLVVSCFLFIQGCTYRAWYQGFQKRQRRACYENRGRGETQDAPGLPRYSSLCRVGYKQDVVKWTDPGRSL